MRLELAQFGSNDTLTLDESDIADSGIDAELRHTAIGTLNATLAGTRDIEPFAQRQGRVTLYTDSDEPVFTGVALRASTDRRQATSRFEAAGLGKLLEDDSPDSIPVVYQNIALQDAIRDYWDTYTRFSNVSVTDETPETVATDQLVYEASTTSEFQSILSPSDTDPLTISNDAVQVLQTSFTVEGEGFDRSFGTESFIRDEDVYSSLEAVVFGDSSVTYEYDFTLDYDIPAGEFAIYYRTERDETNGLAPAIEWSLDGNFIGETNQVDQLGWREVYNTVNETPDRIEAGSHTIQATNAVNGSGGANIVDVIAPLDDRFSYTFDNTQNANDYLTGPELFPDRALAEFVTETVGFNVDAATLTTTWNDTSNGQRLSVSNDGGVSYQSASNTETTTQTFAGPGREPRARVGLSRFGSRDSATPDSGFNGQEIQSLEFRVDLNDLTVIDELELSRNHFDNLKTLHNYGSFLWVFDYDDSAVSDVPVFSFPRGAETRPLPAAADRRQNERVEAATTQYANEIFLQGALDDQTNTRPTATATDSRAVSDDGKTIRLTLRDPTISTEGGAIFRANALLDRVQEEQAIRGELTADPTFATPGFARAVAFLDDPTRELTVETVRTRLSDGALRSTLNFVPDSGLNDRITDLQRNVRDQGNQV